MQCTVHRLSEHKADIKNKNTKNGMAMHLAILHKKNVGDPDSFEWIISSFKTHVVFILSEKNFQN